ncbi:thyroid transcription factor 1-associated protein 26 [Zophobas morio]|uniref:thyroid transcription factor 1-associated protein 26 n=1 Tax=Zophobas morio TaxID=2755281 RepID=UPI003082A2D4
MGKTKVLPQKLTKGNDSFFVGTTKKLDPSSSSSSGSQGFFTTSVSSKPDTDHKFSEKKKFDKNKWRVQKYSLKNKVEKWQNKRTQHIRHEYMKKQRSKNKPITFDVQKIYEEEERREKEDDQVDTNDAENKDNSGEFSEHSGKRRNRKRKTSLESRQENEQSKEEFLRMKAEKEKATKEYWKKKLEKQKKMNKKTKRGQPVMKGRMELLLEKIQEDLNS